jgi:hypothetical protein
MLGIDDPLIWLAYVGCVLATLLSVGYGVARRNRAPDRLTREDRAWAKAEKKVEDEV